MDNDDRLLSEGKGMNENHEIKFRERVLSKSFLDRFYVDNTCSKRYHYTSPEGLMGIFKTRTFYFTDSQFLNDFREKININDENLSVYPISFILRKEGLCLYCYNTNNNEYVVVLINKISEITNLQKSCDLKLYKYGENKEKIKFIL